MKWLKSTTQKMWTVNGKIIPACITPNNDYLVIDEDEYVRISKVPVIVSLIKAGSILVLNEEPAELKNSLTGLQESNASLMVKNTMLEEEVKRLKESHAEVDVEAIKQEAQAEIREEAIKELQEKQNRIEELEKQLEEAKKKNKNKNQGQE